MRHTARLLLVPLVLSLSPSLAAQEALPAGTTLPVTLTSSLNSSASRPGDRFTARIMQAISVKSSVVIPAGAMVLGEVTGAQPGSQTGSSLSIRFDRIVAKKREIPTTVGLRALASRTEIIDAQAPKTGPDDATSSLSWTTVQVGDDVLYGARGPVMAGEMQVGRGVPGGVLARVTANPGSECAEDWPSSSQPQPLWVFSSGACGIYGVPDLIIRHSGTTPPVGEIVLSSSRKVLKLPSGTGLLLQVIADSH